MIAGSKLRAFREKRNVTPNELAKALGVTRQAIGETERRAGVSLPVAERFVNACIALEAERHANAFAPEIEFVVAARYNPHEVFVDPGLIDELQELVS